MISIPGSWPNGLSALEESTSDNVLCETEPLRVILRVGNGLTTALVPASPDQHPSQTLVSANRHTVPLIEMKD